MKKIVSVPETVYVKTFRLEPASSFSIFVGAKTDFEQRKEIICLFYTRLFSTNILLTFVSARMKDATESQLFKCVCNTFNMQLAFRLIVEFQCM